MRYAKRFVLTLLVAVLFAATALATPAKVVMYVGPTGQSLYARFETSDGVYLAFALIEGTGGGKGRYYAYDSDIVDLGLTAAGTYVGTIHSGSSPSTTAEDAILGEYELAWNGASEASAVTADTRDLQPTQFTWEISRRSDGTLVSTNTLRIAPGETIRAGFNCNRQLVLPTGIVLASMTDPTSTATNVTATKLGVDPTNAKASVAAASNAVGGTTGYVRTSVTNSNGAGPITLLGKVEVVAEP